MEKQDAEKVAENLILHCALSQGLVQEFNRLTGHHMGERRSPLSEAIDAATGYDADREAFPDFVEFVCDCVLPALCVGT